MLIDVNLYTKNNEFVATIQCPNMNPPADILLWGERHFIRQGNDEYHEGFCVAVMTEEEYKELIKNNE